MSDLREHPVDATVVPGRAPRPERTPAAPAAPRRPAPTLRWVVGCTVGWVAVVVLSVAVVVYAVGPLLQARAQRALLDELSRSIDQSVGAVDDSLFGVAAPTRAPDPGTPVALLEIGALGVRTAVAEGVSPSTTQGGPGHVPGTAGPGQPGNSVVVGRRAGFGGPFADLSRLALGDQVVVTTVQGRSLYVVDSVTVGPLDRTTTYGPSDDNRLTLVTSSTTNVLNTGAATTVGAVLQTEPFTPTPQGTRSDAEDGTTADAGQWPLLVLLGLLLAGVAAGSSVLYRRWSPVATYAITTPALVSVVVFTSIVAARLLPAWV